MMTNQNGISMICASLDFWFRERQDRILDDTEFRTDDWRLQKLLGTSHFRVAPDFRTSRGRRGSDGEKNLYLTVPAFRFPAWHYCPECGHLREVPLTTRGRVLCRRCRKGSAASSREVEMYQVRFVAVCDHGHIQDFPWNEWVHKDADSRCDGELTYEGKGGGSLSSIYVKCSCGKQRSLASITLAYTDGRTFLTEELALGSRFTCQGGQPWAGSQTGALCDRPLRGSLRNASNVYFADIRSSLYLPRSEDGQMQELVLLLGEPKFTSIRTAVESGTMTTASACPFVRDAGGLQVKHYSDEELAEAIALAAGVVPVKAGAESNTVEEDEQTAFRRQEYDTLRTPRVGELLTVRDPGLENYAADLRTCFSRVMLVDRLRETRVLTGFTRLVPEGGPEDDAERRRAQLWEHVPPRGSQQDWLPASVVYGEGLFFEFNEKRLQEWEAGEEVKERFKLIVHNFQHSKHYDPDHLVGPRFILIHTFAHLLINQLVFECGYSTASLRERLYASSNPEAPMAGLLIYTAAGDADGTMGGLVRMGRAGSLEPVLRKAVQGATWCSADPICMEAAAHGGQGPDSCNLAACHNCSLVPETSCEEFNRFLDRAMVIGMDDEESRFFRALLT